MANSPSILDFKLELLSGFASHLCSLLFLKKKASKQQRPSAKMATPIKKKTYMSVRVFIVLKLAREPYNLTSKNIIEVLRDYAAIVELHVDENQNLTEEDKIYVTERFCWETICKFSSRNKQACKHDEDERHVLTRRQSATQMTRFLENPQSIPFAKSSRAPAVSGWNNVASIVLSFASCFAPLVVTETIASTSVPTTTRIVQSAFWRRKNRLVQMVPTT